MRRTIPSSNCLPLAEKVLFGSTIFLGAFLLFQVQPMIAKLILPRFGGSAAVWIACMFFFQCGLLGGYVYSHWSIRHLRPINQALVHGALLAASLFPLIHAKNTRMINAQAIDPLVHIFIILSLTIGLPYFLLSSTSPLLQAWYSRARNLALPYRLFALSNLASLTGLLAYPFFIEPNLTLRQQSAIWSGTYAFFVLLSTAVALRSSRIRAAEDSTAEVTVTPTDTSAPTFGQRLLWLLLSACGSVLLLSVTNYLTQKVAPVPFLWVLPLSLYLLSFTLSFESNTWYRRNWYVWIVTLALGGMSYLMVEGFRITDMKLIIPFFSAGLFFCCMFCHGELARRKPSPMYLTSFYVMISAGGAAGGLFVGLIAPRIFTDYLELPIGMLVCGSLLFFLNYRNRRLTDIVCLILIIRLIVSAGVYAYSFGDGTLVQTRNFYGTLKVIEYNKNTNNEFREMAHGNVTHGIQYVSPQRRGEPLAYYRPESGVGLAIGLLGKGPRRVGIVGLGAGSLTLYARPGDFYRFYEINPQVAELARKEFSFLSACKGEVEIVSGDGRLLLEKESGNNYDLLVIDAFAGDAIPVHLITLQAIQVYFDHLKPTGILALNISNRHLDLSPVVYTLSIRLAKKAIYIRTRDTLNGKVFNADWVLMTADQGLFEIPWIKQASSPFIPRPDVGLWTDDNNNLFQVLK